MTPTRPVVLRRRAVTGCAAVIAAVARFAVNATAFLAGAVAFVAIAIAVAAVVSEIFGM